MRPHSVRDAPDTTHGFRDTAGPFQGRSNAGTHDAGKGRMDTASRWLIAHGEHLRLAWLVMLVLVAACNNNSDGGANGY